MICRWSQVRIVTMQSVGGPGSTLIPSVEMRPGRFGTQSAEAQCIPEEDNNNAPLPLASISSLLCEARFTYKGVVKVRSVHSQLEP